MSASMRPGLVAGVLAFAFSLAWAQAGGAPGSDAAERARIATERRAVEDRFDAASRDCETRFMVTDCLADARAQRREALAPLQRQLHLLDDARRRQRAVERLRAIQARESAAAARPALGASTAAASAPAQPSAPRAVRPADRATAPAPPQSPDRAARHAQRLQQARAHEAAVMARNASRDARQPPAAGLPVPAAPASTP